VIPRWRGDFDAFDAGQREITEDRIIRDMLAAIMAQRFPERESRPRRNPDEVSHTGIVWHPEHSERQGSSVIWHLKVRRRRSLSAMQD